MPTADVQSFRREEERPLGAQLQVTPGEVWSLDIIVVTDLGIDRLAAELVNVCFVPIADIGRARLRKRDAQPMSLAGLNPSGPLSLPSLRCDEGRGASMAGHRRRRSAAIMA